MKLWWLEGDRVCCRTVGSGTGACHLFALSLNLSPNGGIKTLTVLLPFAQDWEKGVGDEGNAGFANMTGSLRH